MDGHIDGMSRGRLTATSEKLCIQLENPLRPIEMQSNLLEKPMPSAKHSSLLDEHTMSSLSFVCSYEALLVEGRLVLTIWDIVSSRQPCFIARQVRPEWLGTLKESLLTLNIEGTNLTFSRL